MDPGKILCSVISFFQSPFQRTIWLDCWDSGTLNFCFLTGVFTPELHSIKKCPAVFSHWCLVWVGKVYSEGKTWLTKSHCRWIQGCCIWFCTWSWWRHFHRTYSILPYRWQLDILSMCNKKRHRYRLRSLHNSRTCRSAIDFVRLGQQSQIAVAWWR